MKVYISSTYRDLREYPRFFMLSLQGQSVAAWPGITATSTYRIDIVSSRQLRCAFITDGGSAIIKRLVPRPILEHKW